MMEIINKLITILTKTVVFLAGFAIFLISARSVSAAVTFDAVSESHTGTSGSTSGIAFSWTHTPVGTPRGVVVFVYTVETSTPNDFNVTYGGTLMTLVSGGAAADTAGEPGVVRTYFLGSSVPTGASTVNVPRNVETGPHMYAIAYTVTATTNTEIYTPGIILLQEDGEFADQLVTDGSPGTNSLRFVGGYFGGNNVPSTGIFTFPGHSIDLGAFAAFSGYEGGAGQGSREIGYLSSADDRAGVHFAVREVSGPTNTPTPTPAGITISGTINQSDETTAYDCSTGGPYTVRLRVNGAGTYSGDCTLNTGAWEVTGVSVSSGQTVYAYLYNETPKGNTVLISNGTTQSNVPIYVNIVTLRDDANGSITNAEILAGNTADTDDLITTTATDVTIGSSYETHIYTADTYAPGTTITTGKLHVVGNYSGSSETLTLTGSGTDTSRPLYINGGTFTAPATTVFQGTSATDIESTTFNALSFTPTITSGIAYTFLGAETINGNFTVNPTAATSLALTVNLGGTATVGSAYTTTLSGTTSGTSRLDTRPVSTDYNLSTGKINIAAAGTIDAASSASTISLTGTSGTLFTRIGTFTPGSSTVQVTNANGTPTLNSGTVSFYNLTIDPTTTTINTTTDAITVANTLNVATGDTLSLTSGQNLTHSGATLTLSGTISGAGTYAYQSATAFPTTGTISSVLRMDATNNDQSMGARTYGGNVVIYNNSGAAGRNIVLGTAAGQTLTFSGNVDILADANQTITLTGAANNPTVNITGNLSGNAGGDGLRQNITTGTGTWTVSGNVNLTEINTFTATSNTFRMNGTSKTLTSASEAFDNFSVVGGSISTTDAMNVDGHFSITSGSFDLNGQTMNVAGNYNNDAAFIHSNGTVNFDSQVGPRLIDADGPGTDSFYNITFNDNGTSGAWSFGADAATVINSLTITGGAVTAPSTTLTIGNDFTNNDGFIHNSGTIVFNDNTQTSTLTYSAATTFNNFTVATAGKAMQFDNDAQTNIAGLYNIQGTDCTTGRIFLDSDVNDFAWEIYVSGTYDLDYADIEDSTAVTTSLTADNSTEANNNNTNWTVNAGACAGPTATNTPTPTPTSTPTPTVTPTPDPNAHESRIKGNLNIQGGVRIK